MDWYYSQAGVQQGPVEAEKIHALLQTGQLQRTDLAWKQGMAQWVALHQLAEFGGQAQSSLALSQPSTHQAWQQALSPQQAELLGIWQPLVREHKWLKFIGILTLISGVLGAFSLVGIPLIFVGLWMMRAATLLEGMERSPHPAQAREVNVELGRSIKLYGIYLLIYLLLMALFLVMYLLIFLFFGGMALIGGLAASAN